MAVLVWQELSELAVGVVAVLCGAGWDMVASRVRLAWHGVVREGPGCVEKDAVGVGKVGGSKRPLDAKVAKPGCEGAVKGMFGCDN